MHNLSGPYGVGRVLKDPNNECIKHVYPLQFKLNMRCHAEPSELVVPHPLRFLKEYKQSIPMVIRDKR